MERIFPQNLKNHWDTPKGLIQVFMGPRQVGKTTTALALMDKATSVYASADLPLPPTTDFIVTHWEQARKIDSPQRTLVLDEVQKIPRWSEVVKQLWDEDQRNQLAMRVCLLGSSAILLEKGLSESLTGRFEVSSFPHWTYPECHAAFKISLADYVHIGGYPKMYDLRDDADRMENYLQSGIIEPTLGRDILVLHNVDKPALLRQLFWYVSRLPAQTVSYEKILGHLQGSGNSATLVHYAELLAMAFVVMPISKFSGKAHRTKRSIPKWILPNPALVDPSQRKEGLSGFVFENLVGSHLLNITFGKKQFELNYWRDKTSEVDFVVTERNVPILAIEVKSGRIKNIPSPDGLAAKGLDCKFLVVSPKNMDSFFKTTSLAEIIWGSAI